MSSELDYPATEPNPQHCVVGSVAYDDPFEWLEADTDEVLEWQGAQDALAREYLRAIPEWARTDETIKHLHVDTIGYLTTRPAGDRWLRYRVPEGARLNVLEVATTREGQGRTLVDLNALANGRQLTLLHWTPSLDGRFIVYAIAEGSSDATQVVVVDVDSGESLIEGLPHESVYYVTWLSDHSGFYYWARQMEGETGIWLQLLDGSHPTKEAIDLEKQRANVQASPDGATLLAFIDERPRFMRRDGKWSRFLADSDARLRGSIIGDTFVAVIDDTPNGRVVAIPLDSPDDRDTWREVVPGGDAVIRSVMPVGRRLVLLELADAATRLRVVDLDGSVVGNVPLPEPGVVLDGHGRGETYDFVFSSLVRAPAYYRCYLGSLKVERLTEPAATIENVRSEYVSTPSKDGTPVYYRLLSKESTDLSKPRPTIIYAYGATQNINPPLWLYAVIPAWIELGGVYVHAHIRGGGEFGIEWWQGGRLQTKQNTYDDFCAIAEDIIARGISAPDRLGAYGVSNGGVTVAAAVVRRPDLFRAVVSALPILDLMHARKDPTTMLYMMGEYGDPDDPTDAPNVFACSPYHNVREGVPYPAAFFDHGGNDGDCPPWHGRKMVARLQHDSNSGHPALLRIYKNMGHNLASDEEWIERESEELAFFIHELGLNVP